ncbi:MAG: NnrS family protein [Pseudomonadota bacterium]
MIAGADRGLGWRRSAFLSLGLRPFFLAGALWAALAMLLWIGMLTGTPMLPSAFDPVSWHAHEFLFGYLSAIIAGFLLTAVSNWTGRPPIMGAALAALVALWIAGRLAVAFSDHLTPAVVMAIDLSMPVALAATIAFELIKGRNWRNLIVLAMLTTLIAGNAVFHLEAIAGVYAANGVGLRIGLGASVMMIAVIGGRIVPSFTRNWLTKQGKTSLPSPPSRLDWIALLTLMLALVYWVASPGWALTGAAMVMAGLLHFGRLARWKGEATFGEPLVFVLHAGYAFVPIGTLALGLSILATDGSDTIGAQHLLMAGAIGLMTLAVMTRATLGHTGGELRADVRTAILYLFVIIAVVARVASGLAPSIGQDLLLVSATCWIAAFGGFVMVYGPYLIGSQRNP